MKQPQEKANRKSLHMKSSNWADTLNHSKDRLFARIEGGSGF